MIPQSNTLARILAPEDLQVGDYVTVVGTIHQYPSFLWGASEPFETSRVVHLEFWEVENTPFKVKAICLPHVLVSNFERGVQLLDVRRSRLAKVHPEFARTTWRALRRMNSRKGTVAPTT